MSVNKKQIIKRFLSYDSMKTIARYYDLPYRRVCKIINTELGPIQIRELRLARAAKKYDEKLNTMKERYQKARLKS